MALRREGGKEGWPDSSEGDENREEFISYLKSSRFKDEVDWVEIQYGDDLYETKIVSDSDEQRRK
jgi:hypothetical protein